MKIFKAEPIESKLNDPRWTGSTHKKWVIVRAETEGRAINIMSKDYKIATSRQLGVDVLTSPWWDKDLVKWTEINDPKYPVEGKVEGKEEILDKG